MAKARHVYNGIEGLDNIADAYDISVDTLRYRVSRKGMSVSDAVKSIDLRSSKKKEPPIRRRTAGQVGIKHPDLLSKQWKLALGIGAPQ